MPNASDTFLSIDELAARYAVTKQTVYQWNWAGSGPPPIKIGRYVRYRLSDVLAWEVARTASREAAS